VLLAAAVATVAPAERAAMAPVAALFAAMIGLSMWFYTRGVSRPLFVLAGWP
jgi:hypothetical protein